MRNQISRTLLGFALIFMSMNGLWACHNSHLYHNYYNFLGGDTLEVRGQLCIGGGVTGTSNGADGDTRTFSFGFHAQDTNFRLISYSPDSVVGSYTGCTMPSVQVGPLGAPFWTQENVFFTDPGYYGYEPCFSTPFQCITSTALCGNETSQCFNFTFLCVGTLDSMRVFGVEGGGNSIAGCYPDEDMLIPYVIICEVDWETVSAQTLSNAIDIDWSTAKESNILYFGVERSADGQNFEEIGQAQPINAGKFVQEYSFRDENPHLGRNFYRIVDHSQNGETSFSPIAEAYFGALEQLQIISAGPNPFSDRLRLRIASEKAISLQFELMDALGRKVANFAHAAHAGENVIELLTEQYAPGTYFLRIQGEGISKTRKLLKL